MLTSREEHLGNRIQKRGSNRVWKVESGNNFQGKVTIKIMASHTFVSIYYMLGIFNSSYSSCSRHNFNLHNKSQEGGAMVISFSG